MNCKNLLFTILLAVLPGLLWAQAGGIYDAVTKQPIPFATIKFGTGGRGMIADLDGKFELPHPISVAYIEITSLGYKTSRITLPAKNLTIYLQPDDNTLGEITVKPPYEKMRRIINNAIANKPRNNPDKYDWYQCHVYYKMVVDAFFPDTVLNDTSKDSRDIKDFFDRQHLLMSETYSIRTWKKPQRLQEDVLASRFSGLRKPAFTSLVTDIQPFHAYSDYIALNGKDYHNPVSRGFEQYYKFNLSDELLQGTDTVWVLSFSPRGNRANNLTGKVYINSDGYAISQIVAAGSDTMLKLNVRIEQQYERIAVSDSLRRWFPAHLNYIIDFRQKVDKTEFTYHLKGNSKIDSVTWQEDNNFKFDRAHTVRLSGNADKLTTTEWDRYRADTLDSKEATTYKVIDSLGEKYKADKILSYLSKLPDSKIPIGPVDIDIRRLVSVNRYEGTRWGMGLQTNERVVKWLSVGGWAGYGTRDKEWKYGAFAEIYADRYKEFVFRFAYNNDLQDPGRIHLHRELDKGYLKRLLMYRVDQVIEYTASVRKKLGYWNLELGGAMQDIIPRYPYAFVNGSLPDSAYMAQELTINFRYAYAERTSPFFNSYRRLSSKYPVLYGKITAGGQQWRNSSVTNNYLQAIAAIQYRKHINRIGDERFLLMGGKSWSVAPLPLGKLFAGNGFKYDNKSNIGIYSFGGLMVAYPYEFYTDQFVHFIYRHDFDWKLFRLENRQITYSAAPNLALQYNLLYGTLSAPYVHQKVTLSVPDNGYHELGFIVNNLVRMRVSDLYYLTLNMGYFGQIVPGFDMKKNGRFVYGLGVEL